MSAEKTYDSAQTEQYLQANLPNWSLDQGWISRKYTTGGWPFTLMLVSSVGYIAEAAFHHPDLKVSWSQVIVKLQTHSAKGITDKDFQLAKRIEETVTWLPDEADACDGFEKGFKKKWIR